MDADIALCNSLGDIQATALATQIGLAHVVEQPRVTCTLGIYVTIG